jgi:hypothetical protein
MINDMSEKPPVRPGTPSEKFTALNTRTYQNIVTKIGKRYTCMLYPRASNWNVRLSIGRIPPEIKWVT